jgi:hypothetical protein
VATAHIAYESATGRILLVHHYAGEPGDLEGDRRAAAELSETSEDEVAMMSVAADQIAPKRHYRVDPEQKTVVEAEAGEGGIGFGVESVDASAERPGGSEYPPGTS